MSELKQRKGTVVAQPSTPPQQARHDAKGTLQKHRSAWWKIILRIFGALVFLNFCLSYLITDTALWGHENKWTNWRNYIPRRQRVFTQAELAAYDGSNPELPILLAVEGDVYDVTRGRHFYGPGGPYNLFAGRDASRAFGTNCLEREDHLTHDTRGLTERELAGIKGWHHKFENHQDYVKVGTVRLEPIAADAPIPPECKGAQPKPV
ncbi:hypothetical protein IWW55_003938 [Coemansia sp. RSA 2706]|nr:hypothetical protein LPJ63_001600 [Coemansia sp. RSA 2711]KAJ1848042.1 hypothetical protein LPJ70_001223 [Coemansia sp. RSA 2708]KAJ2300545.1 hypothetical protein IWW55_003938 [Coemansia sp. RSA 2706]KAJ2305939.1 hypothetical protein IWW54_004911 [Coemansia sp. RSA 2705]KAJ2313021.1 hypothetical protein IWW52_004690 [Coemansia sp. RSA 2704]KAJ2323989.1 hypothetical protein IWW51_003494 [Coemansia sp. RSA 2702]KAJ2362099.1 hypothetical protein H4S01_004952 [Coemansia sp. RSA 2610]KAJ238019